MKTASKIISGLFSYNGGKKRLIEELKKILGKYGAKIFIDLCGGSGCVTANVFAGRRIINELSTEIAIIFKALSSEITAYQLADEMRSLFISYETYAMAMQYLDENKDKHLDDYSIEELPLAAAYSWYVHFFSRVGSKKSKSPTFSNKKMDGWMNLVNGKILEYIERFDGVEVWNMDVCDALKRIKAEIKEECTIYIDPPYLSDKNSDVKTNKNTYKGNSSKSNCGFDEDKHRKMLSLANAMNPKKYHIVISNYENELYDNMIETDPKYHSWSKEFVKEIYIECGNGANCYEGRKKAREYVYENSS